MLKKVLIQILCCSFLSTNALFASNVDALDLYDWVESLGGEWILSPVDKQLDTDSYKNKDVLPLIGTQQTGISFKSIGARSTVQEDLLPNTPRQMVTMYHCKDIACTQIKATHYCVKQNQPELIGNLEISTKDRMVFDCDMSSELCQSSENHVHQIVHELSNNGKHLKTSYFVWENKKLHNKHTIYHFDKK